MAPAKPLSKDTMKPTRLLYQGRKTVSAEMNIKSRSVKNTLEICFKGVGGGRAIMRAIIWGGWRGRLASPTGPARRGWTPEIGSGRSRAVRRWGPQHTWPGAAGVGGGSGGPMMCGGQPTIKVWGTAT